MKKEIRQLLFKYKHENDVHEHSKTNEPQKFVLNLSQKISHMKFD